MNIIRVEGIIWQRIGVRNGKSGYEIRIEIKEESGEAMETWKLAKKQEEKMFRKKRDDEEQINEVKRECRRETQLIAD